MVAGYMFEASNSGPSGPCEVSATDDGGVAKVVFFLDGAQLNVEYLPPWNCRFDTTLVANGTHTLKAIAYDASGASSSAQRTLNVRNEVAPAPEPTPPPSGRTLVFEDNFDGLAVNTTHWSPYYSPGHGGNGLRRPSAFTQANGLLVVTASWDGTNIVSGGMSHRANYLYGRFEARVRTESDSTGQLSGVILTWPQSNVWPRDGELDFYETGTSVSRWPFSSFLHWMNATRGDQQTYIRHEADAREWHVMAMEWEPSAIRIYRDGVLIGSLTDPAKIPNVAHHMSIQLDAFGNQPLPGPVRMYVDWVRVYR